MKPNALVATTVHWPDDPRIRERLVRTLSRDFSIVYAARSPGPTDRSDLVYRELRGGRLRRNFEALALFLFSRWDVLVLHDPEMLPAGLIARLIRRRPVVFDLHENYPALAHTREWVPEWMKAPLAWVARASISLGERLLEISLAEPGYGQMLTGNHPVFPNYPDTSSYPSVRRERTDEAVYLGDVTFARGVEIAVQACSISDTPLRLIGRVAPEIEEFLSQPREGLVIEGPLANPEALRLVSRAAVGLVPLRDIPNYRDSQPTKLLEYLALGVPVVASDLPGTRSLVEGLEAVWLVRPGDPDAMAGAISEARTVSAREAAMAQAGSIRKRFQWPADEVRAFYGSLVSR